MRRNELAIIYRYISRKIIAFKNELGASSGSLSGSLVQNPKRHTRLKLVEAQNNSDIYRNMIF